MFEALTAANSIINLVLLPMIIVALFKGRWQYVKYLWLVISVLGTASLVIELYLGKPTIQLVISIIFVGIVLLNTYSAFKPRKAE